MISPRPLSTTLKSPQAKLDKCSPSQAGRRIARPVLSFASSSERRVQQAQVTPITSIAPVIEWNPAHKKEFEKLLRCVEGTKFTRAENSRTPRCSASVGQAFSCQSVPEEPPKFS